MRPCVLALSVPLILTAQPAIEGSVINRVTGAGIGGATVRFYTAKGVHYEATTSTDGNFQIAGVEPGEYRRSVEKEGFEPPARPEFPASEATIRISGKDTFRATFEMTAWTTLHGRVVDSDGRPTPRLRIQIRGPVPPREDTEISTANDGSFQFNRLPPGSYMLIARPEPAKTVPVDGVRMETVATYYPSALDASQAQPIVIRGVGEETGFEIRLRRAPVYRVRGILLDDAGKPAPSLRVAISTAHQVLPANPSPAERFVTTIGGTDYYLPGFPSEPAIADVVTAPDGAFEFSSIPEGDWAIQAASEWQYEEATRRDIQQTGQAQVSVKKSDVDDVEIHLASNFEFSASVIWPEDSPSAPRWSMIALLPVSIGLEHTSMGMMKSDGTLQFERVYPGRYIVASLANGAPTTYISAVRFGGRDVLGQEIDLAPNPPAMQIAYKSGAGALRAQFEKNPSATFVLIPAAPEGGYPRSLQCDGAGPCEVSGLRPGDYFAAGFDRVDKAKLSNPAYVASLVPFMTRVRIEENSNQVLSLSVSHWPE